MKVKYITAAFAFAVTFGFSVLLSGKIDDANLPPDFRNVWLEHLKAWRTQADFLKQSNLSDEKITDAEFLQTYRYQNAEIQRTWFDVLDVAREYDAVIPRNAY
jgi:hypothetical protein